jgi:transposase
VPPRHQREWRDLTRHRVQIVAQITQTANRIQKILEDANIKLSSVASDVLGVSGREMIRLMIQGVDDPIALAGCARRRLKSKTGQLREALAGKLSEHHRFMLRLMMDQLEQLESLVKRIEDRLDEAMKDYAKQIELLDTIPGVDKRVAQTLLAEVGPEMSRFPSDHALACWAGMCPGNDRSAQRRRSGRTVAANRWLRRALVQAGWAASHTKSTYLSAQYRRLVSRRGKKRALIAVGHSILISVYHILKNNERYRDLGPDHFQLREPNRLISQLVRRLQALGQNVILAPAA